MAPLIDARLAIVVADLPVSFILIAAIRRSIENRPNRPSLPPGPVPLLLLGNISTVDAKEPWLTYTEWRAACSRRDVELGCDWLAFVNARFDGSRFLRPLETDLARLCAGHTWNFQAGVESYLATQAGLSSVTQAGLSSVTQAGSSSRSYQVQHNDHVVDKFFDGHEKLRRPDLSALADAHGLSVDDHSSIEDLREIISHHVGMGLCSSPLSQAFEGCESLRQQLNVHCEDEGEVLSGRIAFLTAILTNTKRRPLERLLKANGVDFELGSKTGRLRRTLKKHIHSLKKAKSKPSEQAREIHRRQLRSDWPQIPSPQLKRHFVQMFKDETSSAKLDTFTCACSVIASLDDFDPSLLHSPDRQNDQHMLNDYFDKDCPLPQLPFSKEGKACKGRQGKRENGLIHVSASRRNGTDESCLL
ncbi:hypothetical protein F4604DRAFT_1932259 [Suillus subluteus]|nr:hypothetical protein F4604DRAFT_1932259 [Suillus subluteus]